MTSIKVFFTSKPACYFNGIYKGAAVLVLKHFMTKSTALSLRSLLYSKSVKISNKLEGMLYYCKED